MLLNEREAKTKICHKFFANSTFSKSILTPRCITSECMAWRWSEPKFSYGTPTSNITVEHKDRLGYCGEAGISKYE